MIYFIRQVSTGYIKIGCTLNVWARMVKLQKDYGEVELIGGTYGQQTDEIKLHHRFEYLNVAQITLANRNSYGIEWFYPDEEIVGYIKDALSMPLIEGLIAKRKNNPRRGRTTLRVNLLSHSAPSCLSKPISI